MQQVTKVKLPWTLRKSDSWGDICAWAIENYGLPGYRYTWHPKGECMEFHFVEEKDAMHLMLRWL